jgi:hypothetical protein
MEAKAVSNWKLKAIPLALSVLCMCFFTLATAHAQVTTSAQRPRSGSLQLSFSSADGKTRATEDVAFSLAPLGAQSYTVTIKTPESPGEYILLAIATPVDDSHHPTVSRRHVLLQSSTAPEKR